MRIKFTKISCFFTLLFPLAVFSEDLIGALELALKNDPLYKQAAANALSAHQGVEVAKSGFRPSVNLSASRTGYNNVTIITDSVQGTVNNNNRTNALSVSQTVFDWPSLMTVKQSQAIDKRQEALYRAALQDVMVRTARAYFAVLQAEDTLRYTIAQHEANERQLSQAKERFKVGLDAITTVDEARAEYDATIALELSARNDVQTAKELLRAITGVYIDTIVPVAENLPLESPEPQDAGYWVDVGIKHNYTLMASKHAAEAAKRNIGVNLGGNFPILNLVANLNDNKGANFGSGPFDLITKNVGVELNFPIQGGAVVSSTRRAQYDYESALAEMDGQMKLVISRGHQLYNSVISGIGIVKADRAAVVSRISSLNSTEAAYKVGTRTIVDVLSQQRDLFDARRQLASDQYTYLNDFLDLKQNAGTLNIADVEEINSWLKGKTALTTSDRDIAKHAPVKPYPSASNAFLRPYPVKNTVLDEAMTAEQASSSPEAKPIDKPEAARVEPVKPIASAKILPQKETVKPSASEKTIPVASNPSPSEGLAPSKWLAAGSFKNEENAKRLAATLASLTREKTHVETKTVASTTYYQVQLGPLSQGKQQIASLKAVLNKAGYHDIQLISHA